MKNLTQLNIHRAGRRKRRKIICLNVKTLTLTLENQIYGESWDPLLGLELNSPGLPGYRRIKGYRRTRDTEDPWIQENTGIQKNTEIQEIIGYRRTRDTARRIQG